MQTTPYFISTGELSAMYTLRERGHYYTGEGVKMPTSYYVKNLSTNKEKAIKKALAYTGLKEINFGAPDDLNEYREGVAQAEREAREQAQRDYEAMLKTREEHQNELIKKGLYPFGDGTDKHAKSISELDVGLVNWWATMAEVEADTPAYNLQNYIKEHCQDLLFPVPNNDYFGEVKKRYEFNVTVTKSISFMSYDYYGREETKFITTMVTDQGYCLVVFSTAFYPEVGEKMKVKATVKNHKEYDGQAQTIVQRVNEVKPKNK